MTGVIKEIIDDNIPSINGRPAIKKKIATVEFDNGESAAIEFIGNLRRTLIRGFKVNDTVEVKYTQKAEKNKHNNLKAKSIKHHEVPIEHT